MVGSAKRERPTQRHAVGESITGTTDLALSSSWNRRRLNPFRTATMSPHKYIEPKPTHYKKLLFRSVTEARTAVLLDNCSNIMNWGYETRTYTLKPQNWDYTPDFDITLYLRGELGKIYLEVKPEVPSEEYFSVLKEMSRLMRRPLLVLIPDYYHEASLSYAVIRQKISQIDPARFFTNFEEAFTRAAKFRFDLRSQ